MSYVSLSDLVAAMSSTGMGQAAATCVSAFPTNSAADEAAARFAAMTPEQKAALRTPHMAAVASLPEDQRQAEADKLVVAALSEQVRLERLNLRLCQDIVREVVDQIVGLPPIGAPNHVIAPMFARDRLYTVRDYAIQRGVPLDRVVQAIRAEVYRRLPGNADPYPQGDLENLYDRILEMSRPPAVYSLPPPPPQVQTMAPVPSAPIMTTAAPAPAAPVEPAPQPARTRRPRAEPQSLTTPIIVAGGLIAAAVIWSSMNK